MNALGASLERLANWLKTARDGGWSPTPERQGLLDLARHLDGTAEMLEDPRWLDLEGFVNGQQDARGALPCRPSEERPAHYQGAAWDLRGIAEKAREMADALPDPRSRPERHYAADVFLHLWHDAGRDRPTMTGTMDEQAPSEAVREFARVLEEAGAPCSVDTARKLLAAAISRFDPTLKPPGYDDFCDNRMI